MLNVFFEWMRVKIKLHSVLESSPLVNERDLWWISFGQNIGSEINGKSRIFTRPGLIIKKLSQGFFLVAPTTSQEKQGSWYVPINLESKEMNVCLHQIRTIDYRRFSTKLGRIGTEDFIRVKKAFGHLYQ